MIEHALQYAGRGWRVFPVHATAGGQCSCNRECGKDAGKHPRVKGWQKAATSDSQQIQKWWGQRGWENSNIGIATGQGLVVVDIDGERDLATLARLKALHGPLPATLTARTGRGLHAYFSGDLPGSKTVEGLLVRGAGGFVVAPPSLHASGQRYQWVMQAPLAAIPPWFQNWVQTTAGTKETVGTEASPFGPLPGYLQKVKAQQAQGVAEDASSVTSRALRGFKEPWSPEIEARIVSALQAVPASCNRDTWLRIGMALADLQWVGGPEGNDRGFDLWSAWSASCAEKYSLHDVEVRWRSFGKPGRSGVTLGSLFHIAEANGWQGLAPRAADESEVMPNEAGASLAGKSKPETTPHPLFSMGGGAVNGHTSAAATLLAGLTTEDQFTSPLIRLNEQYAVIGDIGGKCLVMGWVPSKVDETIRMPSFQAFRAFTERYASKYVMIRKAKGEEWVDEPTQLGAHWLKWKHRTTYDGIDLMPEATPVLPGNILNLWDGFGVEPQEGKWDRIKEHIAEILAQGSTDSLVYIMKWAAWAVQNPGEHAETALVFRGAKGSGKGTFANAMKRIFGQHGLQIFNSKHLVGSFNGHLRNCLLLFADEAFWAGDKQGESVLKGMLTEPALMIEQKGIDAAPWRNRLHVIMAANAEWVVPASHDERRYAVFSVSEKRLRQEKYFDALHREMQEGGLSAMLHDLQHVNLKGWHPRRIVQTEALQQQKLRSLDPKLEWFEGLLQDGLLPYSGSKEASRTIPTQFVMHHVRENAPRMRDVSTTAIGLFLRGMGCIKMHSAKGNAWQFQGLKEARERWENRFQGWSWDAPLAEWGNRS